MSSYRSRFFTRIVRPYFIMLLIITFVALVLICMTVAERIESNALEGGRQLAEKTAQQTDTYINDLDLIAQQVCHQENIVSFFYDLQKDGDQSNIFDTDMLHAIDISSSLKKILVDRAVYYNITIYNNCGDFISSRNYTLKKKNLSDIISSEEYDLTLNKLNDSGGILITPPTTSRWLNSDDLFITLTKALKNDYSNNICGIIEVRCSVSPLSGIIGTDITSGDRVIITDNDDGSVICPINYSESCYFGKEYVSSNIEKANWTLYLKIPEVLTGGLSINLVLNFLCLYIIIGIFIFIISALLGRYIIKPITQLTQYVKTIDTPNVKLERVNNKAVDEISELEDSFGKMLSRMNHSIAQEKKAYSLALQAQMNPHFLYNTLAVIGATGSEAGCDMVYDMCIKLSDMLRYVTAYQNVTVPLRDELAHTQNYLSLMKSRYEEYFTYTIYADESLANMSVPKLFIQPLAENCFMHGFKEKEPPWNIDISMTGSVMHWELVIKDNGTGISEEKVKEIDKKISDAISNMSIGSIGGLGIVNTIVRLKITHSNHIQYRIRNDNGMCIKIIGESE